MARARTKTWLPLDRWAEIIGINPLHFNQFETGTLQGGITCGHVWFQNAYQNSSRLSREDIAMAIRSAEERISRVVGYNLIPDWTYDERLNYERPTNPMGYFGNGRNGRGMFHSIRAKNAWMISGGTREKTLIEAGATVTRTSEIDVDTYKETCTVTVTVTFTDVDQVRVYYPAHNGEDAWEIRPVDVTISGGTATIKFKSWQIAASNQQLSFNPDAIDPTVDANYESTVDVYRVRNDPSTQVSFLWEEPYSSDWCCGSDTCSACTLATQTGCLHIRNRRQSIIVPAPGTWDSDDEEFDASCCWSACRSPDQLRLWYYSGWRNLDEPYPYTRMDPKWEYAVAYYAASLLDRPVCGCSNVQQFIDRWRSDAALATAQEGATQMTPRLLGNPLGTTLGALYAYRQTQFEGEKVY